MIILQEKLKPYVEVLQLSWLKRILSGHRLVFIFILSLVYNKINQKKKKDVPGPDYGTGE